MDTQLTEYLKCCLSKNNIDGLIINSTNEFLMEYNKLELNSRYYVTGFTGSTGDVLFTQDKIYQFADTRYHQQAENETAADLITVIKMPLGKSFLDALDGVIPSYFRLGIVSSKTSKKFYDALYKKVSAKNGIIKLLGADPVMEYEKDKIKKAEYNVFKLDINACGILADDKFLKVKEYTGLDKYAVISSALEDTAYLTNLRSYDFDFSAVFPAKAVIKQDKAYIYTDCTLPDAGIYFETRPFNEFEKAVKSIENTCVFIDEDNMSIADFNLINKSNTIKKSGLGLMKTIKNEAEISRLKTGFACSDRALKVISRMINSDEIYTEYDYYEALKEELFKNGAQSLSFKPIIAAGSSSSIIHYSSPSKEKKVEDGDLLLVDFGGFYEGGLASDTTRTFIKGTPSDEQRKAYTTVLKAFLNAYYKEYTLKSSYFDIDKEARDTIEKNITPDYAFAHAAGHGLGICVHEIPPRLSNSINSKTKILRNTVFTIEPGVYKEGWGGIRLENTVYASYEGDKVILHSFSHFPFEIKLTDISLMNDDEKYRYMKWQENASCRM